MRTNNKGWTKIENDGTPHLGCPRCGWWIRLSSKQALGKEVIECPRCYWSSYFPFGNKDGDLSFAPLPVAQHKEKSGYPR